MRATSMPLMRDDPTALYRQIETQLRDDIAGGRFSPSGRLPTEAELGALFGVSRVTVRLALASLEQAGLIARRKGKGTFVAGKLVRHALDELHSFHEALRAQGLNATMRLLELEECRMPPALLALFGADRACCSRLRRLHEVDGGPVALACSYLPQPVQALAHSNLRDSPTYALITELAGRPVVHARLSVSAAAAGPDCALLLKLRVGSPVLVLERTSYFAGGTCAEQSSFYVRPERYQFVVSSRLPGLQASC